MMKVGYIYIIILILGFVSFFFVIQAAPSPEKEIVGSWKELTWEYERFDGFQKDTDFPITESDYLKEVIGQELMIHQSETWHFLPDGYLILKSNTADDKVVKWRLKGRGHILQLKYKNNHTENINLTKLSNDQMVLNFESEVQARGIAKLTFEKI